MKGLTHITIVLRALLLATAAVFTGAVPAPAWAQAWIGGGVDGDWSDPANWDGGVVPVSDPSTVLVFGTDGNGFDPTNNTAGFTLRTISLLDGYTRTITGDSLVMERGGLFDVQANVDTTISNDIDLNFVDAGAGNDFSTIRGSGGLALSGVLSSTGDANPDLVRLNITHSGTVVTLSGANTYTGITTVGTLTTLIAASDFALGDPTSPSGVLGGTTLFNASTLALQGGIDLQEEVIAFRNDGGTLRNISGDNTVLGDITLDGTSIQTDAGVLTVQGSIDGEGGLTKTGAGTLVLTGDNTYTNFTSVDMGTLVVDGGSITDIDGGVGVGTVTDGDGILLIQNGGTVSSNADSIATSHDSTGAATVTGAGSTWTADFLAVGNLNNAAGTLTIADGGTVNSGAALFGRDRTSTGAATVTGAGSTWTADFLVVGHNGSGTLTVENGGTVISPTLGIIGDDASHGTNEVTVTGAGSTWTTGTLATNRGNNTLTIEDGGAVINNAAGIIGALADLANPDNSSTVTVTGAGSTWTNAETLTVGQGGIGTLTIDNGGAVSNTEGRIGGIAGSRRGTGTVIVTGADATWTNSADLLVGQFGDGALTIGDGGTVSNATAVIGNDAASTGAVTVTGPASTWTSSADLLVGQSGSGTLTIENGGSVSNGAGSIGSNPGGTGTVTVTGATWINSADLLVGQFGDGTLTIGGGGRVVAAGGNVIVGLNGIGTLNIGGGGGAGILDAAQVNSLANTASLNFNHSDTDYFFTNDGTSGGTAIAIIGTATVNHIGSGLTTLTGTNTYTGSTIVDAGTLRVNGSINSPTTVNAGATFGGTGTSGAVTVNAGGVLSPGASAGTLTTGDLTLNDDSVLAFELAAPGTIGGGVNDHLAVNGDLTLDGVVNITALGGFGSGTYTLISYTGGLIADNGLAIGGLPAGFNAAIDTNTTPGEVTMTVMAAAAELVLMPGIWDFGAVPAGDSALSDPFVVENTGGSDLVVGMVTIEGPAASDFQLEDDICSGQTVAPGDFCGFSVRFTPSAPEVRHAEVYVPGNVPDSPATAVLIGNDVVFSDGFEGN